MFSSCYAVVGSTTHYETLNYISFAGLIQCLLEHVLVFSSELRESKPHAAPVFEPKSPDAKTSILYLLDNNDSQLPNILRLLRHRTSEQRIEGDSIVTSHLWLTQISKSNYCFGSKLICDPKYHHITLLSPPLLDKKPRASIKD